MALGVPKTSLNRQRNGQGKQHPRATGILVAIDQKCKNYTAANGTKTKLYLPKRSERQKSAGQKKLRRKMALGVPKTSLNRQRNGQGKQHPRATGILAIIDQNVNTILPQTAKKQNYTFPNGRKGKNRPDKKHSDETWPWE